MSGTAITERAREGATHGGPAAGSAWHGEGAARPLRVCAVSFKVCWQDQEGRWMSSGGFPLQMRSIASLFDEMVLGITRGEPQPGALPLPERARVVPLRLPAGTDLRRKLSMAARLPYYAWMIARAMRGADVVHVPLPGDIPLVALFIALLARKRTIVRYGGSWSVNARTTTMNRFTIACMRRFAGGRNVMLAAGEGAEPPARDVSWLFSTALTRGELDRIEAEPDRALSDPPRLVCVGRLSQEKGIPVLIRAVARLVESGFRPLPQVELIGDGPARAELEALVRELGLEDRITFTGQIDRPALSRRLARAELCVHPALTESLSKAWLDALAHGLPVLACDVGSARAVFGTPGEHGWLVPPGDVDALEEQLRRVLTEPMDWPALRARCRAFVEERTLECWTERIGERCASQWGWSFAGGKLRP
jgi:glycosyltransferase involved in cell wall biosynthesis